MKPDEHQTASTRCRLPRASAPPTTQAVALYTPEVDAIIRSRTHDKHWIEHTLDHLLAFCGDEAALALFKRLCRYYWDIDPAATADHVYRYREWFGDEPMTTAEQAEPKG